MFFSGVCASLPLQPHLLGSLTDFSAESETHQLPYLYHLSCCSTSTNVLLKTLKTFSVSVHNSKNGLNTFLNFLSKIINNLSWDPPNASPPSSLSEVHQSQQIINPGQIWWRTQTKDSFFPSGSWDKPNSLRNCWVTSTGAQSSTVWFTNCPAAEQKGLCCVVKVAQLAVRMELPKLDTVYASRLRRKASSVFSDPGHSLFGPLPSGKRFRTLKAKTNRLKNSFCPRAASHPSYRAVKTPQCAQQMPLRSALIHTPNTCTDAPFNWSCCQSSAYIFMICCFCVVFCFLHFLFY